MEKIILGIPKEDVEEVIHLLRYAMSEEPTTNDVWSLLMPFCEKHSDIKFNGNAEEFLNYSLKNSKGNRSTCVDESLKFAWDEIQKENKPTNIDAELLIKIIEYSQGNNGSQLKAVSGSEVFEHYGKPFTSGRDLWDFLTAHYNFTPKT
jgi:hypothetical protein